MQVLSWCTRGKIHSHPVSVHQAEHPASQGLQLHFENHQGEVFVPNILISSVVVTHKWRVFEYNVTGFVPEFFQSGSIKLSGGRS